MSNCNMASACALEWVPDSLFNTAVTAIVTYYSRHRKELKALPENVQFDIYYKLYNKGRLCQLGQEFSELDTFARVLKVNDKRHLLHHCFQALMDHGVHVSSILADTFYRQYTPLLCENISDRERAIQLGFSLGGFLNDAGWIKDSERVFVSCLHLCRMEDNPAGWCRALECCVRLFHVRNVNCTYEAGELSCREAEKIVQQLASCGITVNKATLYAERCALLFAKSQYDEAYKYCCMALHEITYSMSAKAIVDVLRQCSKACVVKREFVKAEVLIRQAVHFAKENFGVQHPKYSDALLDYGFYLLNVDSISAAVHVYQTALDIRQAVFGGNNLHMAIAHEDLAYASYVHEYSSGKFKDARDHAEKAIEIIGHILPEDHLLLSSSKRVKALILEEIAIDTHVKETGDQLLHDAQDLHLQSLALAKKAFGENNVQTAKHYGNLGRLYQSMHRYQEAEEMHLKAIEIKERLLGAEDYEVALSVGHLASLYNYDMEKYEEAEKLYLRSISIGKKLFGDGYSGLEYDYRGLMRLYQNEGDFVSMEKYRQVLQEWSQIRDVHNSKDEKPLDFAPLLKLLDMIQQYFG